jgi:hypothetical protein
MKLALAVVVAYGLLLTYAYVFLAPEKPHEKSFTIEGYVTHACGFIVPADTQEDRDWAKTMRYDCDIFPPSHKYGVFR